LRLGRRLGLEPVGLEAFGLEAPQIHDGLALQAAGVIDAALEAGLCVGSVVECLACRAVRAGIIRVFEVRIRDSASILSKLRRRQEARTMLSTRRHSMSVWGW